MLVSRTLQKPGQLMSVATKVGIQINAKLGGEIWSVQIPVRHFILFLIIDKHENQNQSFSLFISVENIDDCWYRYVS